MLEVSNVQIVYDNVIEAVRDVSLTVREGQVVTLLGSNGAGKSTLLKAISGVLYPEYGTIEGGHIKFKNRDISGDMPDAIVRSGLMMVPEGRQLFDKLSVEDNLAMGGYSLSKATALRNIERVYNWFPRLADRRKQTSGYLSGGEQQMVAVGRALMAEPKLLTLDEPSLGLAPQIIEEIFGILMKLAAEENVSILLVEQNAELALSLADYCYIMENGRVVLDDTPEKLRENEDVQEFYLGFSQHGTRKNMREVKHYKRRKRWLS